MVHEPLCVVPNDERQPASTCELHSGALTAIEALPHASMTRVLLHGPGSLNDRQRLLGYFVEIASASGLRTWSIRCSSASSSQSRRSSSSVSSYEASCCRLPYCRTVKYTLM